MIIMTEAMMIGVVSSSLANKFIFRDNVGKQKMKLMSSFPDTMQPCVQWHGKAKEYHLVGSMSRCEYTFRFDGLRANASCQEDEREPKELDTI